MSEMAGTKVRKFVFCAVLIVLGAVVWRAIEMRGKEVRPVSSNQISREKLDELRQSAAAGDASAQYALTLYIDDPGQSEQLLRKAASAGYPPAMVTFAQISMNKGEAEAEKSRMMLEGAAQRGYYPAIVELVRCLDAGECGAASKITAYMWIAVADLLVRQGKGASAQLNEEEERLRPQLTMSEIDQAKAKAKAIVERIPAAGSR